MHVHLHIYKCAHAHRFGVDLIKAAAAIIASG